MPTFTPPTDPFYSLADFDVDTAPSVNNKLSYRLLKFYSGLPKGRNVYKLDDGTYTENDPPDSTTITITYQGGHSHDITEAEADNLTSAGYGEYIN